MLFGEDDVLSDDVLDSDDTIKSDDIVQELYSDETIVLKLNKLLNCKSSGMDLKKKVKEFFFKPVVMRWTLKDSETNWLHS